jgi:excisionase family DNA binding protein
MKLMGLREFARYMGCSLSGVQRAIETGRISHYVINGRKMINPFEAEEEWQRNTRMAMPRIGG